MWPRNVCELGTRAVVMAGGCGSAVHTETTQTDRTVRSTDTQEWAALAVVHDTRVRHTATTQVAMGRCLGASNSLLPTIF